MAYQKPSAADADKMAKTLADIFRCSNSSSIRLSEGKKCKWNPIIMYNLMEFYYTLKHSHLVQSSSGRRRPTDHM